MCEFPKFSTLLYVRFVSTKVPHKMSFSFRAMHKHTFTKYYSPLNPADLCLYMYLSSCVTCCVSLATLCIKYTTNIPRRTDHIPTVIYSYWWYTRFKQRFLKAPIFPPPGRKLTLWLHLVWPAPSYRSGPRGIRLVTTHPHRSSSPKQPNAPKPHCAGQAGGNQRA